MKKKEKKDIIDKILKIKNEMVFDRVNEIFKNNPEDYKKALGEIGFIWFDDEYPDELEEENNAVPQDQIQALLIAYFDGEIAISDRIIEAFLEIKYSEAPNYALLRRYFRCGNKNLKSLIYRGLQMNPTDIGFLNDLSFFHEFHPMLSELIERYTKACMLQDNLAAFSELAQDFYYNTFPDGYEAYHALKEIYGSDTEKGKTIDFLMHIEEDLEETVAKH